MPKVLVPVFRWLVVFFPANFQRRMSEIRRYFLFEFSTFFSLHMGLS